MTDVATLQARLSDAETSLHDLLITGGTTTLRHGDKWMVSGRMSVESLRAYIADLKGQLRAAGVAVAGGRIAARRVYF